VFLQEDRDDRKSERDRQNVLKVSNSASAVMIGTNKKNVQLSKKTSEKKKEKQCTLEDAIQEVVLFDIAIGFQSYLLWSGWIS